MLTLGVFIGSLFGGSYIIYNIHSKKSDKYMLIYACIIITLFCGLIDAQDFGTDIMNYYNRAVAALGCDLSSYLEQGSFEKGYKVFTWAIVNLFHNAQMFLVVQALFVNATICFFIYKNSKNVFISLITYVCFGTFAFYFTAFRQAVALAICLYAVMLIKNRHRLLAIPIILFATLFHQTAIVFMPLILLRDFKINLNNLILFSVIVVVIGLFLDRILQLANEEFDMNYGEHKGLTTSAIGGVINLIIFLFCFILLFFRQKNNFIRLLDSKTDYRHFYIYIGIIAIILYALRFYVLALERVSFYFVPIFSILYGEIFTDEINDKESLTIKILFIFLSLILFMWRFYPLIGGYRTILR